MRESPVADTLSNQPSIQGTESWSNSSDQQNRNLQLPFGQKQPTPVNNQNPYSNGNNNGTSNNTNGNANPTTTPEVKNIPNPATTPLKSSFASTPITPNNQDRGFINQKMPPVPGMNLTMNQNKPKNPNQPYKPPGQSWTPDRNLLPPSNNSMVEGMQFAPSTINPNNRQSQNLLPNQPLVAENDLTRTPVSNLTYSPMGETSQQNLLPAAPNSVNPRRDLPDQRNNLLKNMPAMTPPQTNSGPPALNLPNPPPPYLSKEFNSPVLSHMTSTGPFTFNQPLVANRLNQPFSMGNPMGPAMQNEQFNQLNQNNNANFHVRKQGPYSDLLLNDGAMDLSTPGILGLDSINSSNVWGSEPTPAQDQWWGS